MIHCECWNRKEGHCIPPAEDSTRKKKDRLHAEIIKPKQKLSEYWKCGHRTLQRLYSAYINRKHSVANAIMRKCWLSKINWANFLLQAFPKEDIKWVNGGASNRNFCVSPNSFTLTEGLILFSVISLAMAMLGVMKVQSHWFSVLVLSGGG
jgi:hypothetical protein